MFGKHSFLLRIAAAIILTTSVATGQTDVEKTEAFLDLRHDGVVMNVSAHPDDEDGATLAYYRMKFGVQTYSVFFTRGEGGQNERGPELYEELGVLRTAETERASRLQRTTPYFLNLVDFGFSKTATETFGRWGGSYEVLRRMVFAIRKFKPDVIFTNHNTIDGHGHHQAVAITLLAAFDAAADSTYFPEQLKQQGVGLWQTRKFFMRNFGRTDRTADVVNAIEDTSNVRGMTYFNIAVEALKMHETQGMDRADLRRFTRGLSLYKLVRQNSLYDRDSTTFFSGINFMSEPALKEVLPIRMKLDALRQDVSVDSLLSSIALVQKELRRLQSTAQSPLVVRMLDQWDVELQELLRVTCGIRIKASLKDTVLIPGQRVSLDVTLVPGVCSVSATQFTVNLDSSDWMMKENLPRSSSLSINVPLVVAAGARITLPKARTLYNPIEWERRLSVSAHIQLKSGESLFLRAPVSYEVAPPEVITIRPATTRIGTDGKTFEYTVQNFRPVRTAGKMTASGYEGWRGEVPEYTIAREDGIAKGTLFVKPLGSLKEGSYNLRFATESAETDVRVRAFSVNIAPDVRVGVIRSYDTTLEEALNELGVRYSVLSGEDLATGDLSRWTTILVDIRAYLVREDLKTHNVRLLEYVHKGGNLIVMYQRDQEWKPEYAPYPIEISRKRITVEDAPVTVLRPEHPLFNAPNTITLQDWDGWIQERGLYFPSVVAPEYVHLISSRDPDEPPLSTGYLVASYGTGSYIYTSYVWYRQLKEAHPGAYRCFANMISYPGFRR